MTPTLEQQAEFIARNRACSDESTEICRLPDGNDGPLCRHCRELSDDILIALLAAKAEGARQAAAEVASWLREKASKRPQNVG